jgi:tripartite-type tricarboxylate transporter receptor subunit TctC
MKMINWVRQDVGHISRRTAIGALASLAVTNVFAQGPGYPEKAIKWVVPYAPGGISDTLARTYGQKLAEAWGKPVVVENKAGAATNIGASFVAHSPADGYTLLTASPTFATNPGLFPGQLSYDPVKDFSLVSRLILIPNAIFVAADSPFKTVKDLVDHAKANPGKLSFGHPGIGTIAHLAGELLNVRANIKLTPVAYKGSAQAMTDLLAGVVPAVVDNFPTYFQLVKAGKVRALVIMGPDRVPAMPDIPSMRDAGYQDFDGTGWQGVAVPAGTPQQVIDKLVQEFLRIGKLPEMRQVFESAGYSLIASDPAEFRRWIDAESKRWQTLIRERNIQPN